MEPDQMRVTAAASAVGGAVFWGMYHLATALWGGQPVSRRDIAKAAANVVFAIVAGALVAFFLAPAVIPIIPLAALRDPYAVGFALGFGSWELLPFLLGRLRREGRKVEKGQR